MPKLVDNLGPRNVPQEIKDLRQSSLDFHHTLGQPVIFKHKWNEEDLRAGLATQCPYHDSLYGRDSDWDEYCFGTGYLGGWDQGKIVYVSIADTQEDVFRLTDQGILMRDTHPGMVAPWNPPMGDGDLIIVVEIDPLTNQVVDTYERYMVQEVTPITMRGPGFDAQKRGKLFVVNQQAQIDRLPYNNNLYQVPIDFDYGHVPDPPVDPNIDPDDYIPGTNISSFSVAVRVIGSEQGFTSVMTIPVRVRVAPGSEYTQDVRITGKDDGSHVFLD